ncbi:MULTISPECIES: alpha-glucan family phosphorylase [unclassified Chitinophaga]|uniref:alpha-glucan family phosphorylase n=1 Tax=unclassified Chitinophaga TaxID=2619133 RepID=UPI00300FED15
MGDIRWKPDYIFEVSWEVCNKVGGIHTVLATKARLLEEQWGNRLIMIGPDLPAGITGNPEFTEDKNLFPNWKKHMQKTGMRVRTGRWNIAGNPLVILVDFTPFFQQKNEIFTHFWTKYRLDSLSGQWDYIEPAMFGYAAGKIIEGFYYCHLNATDHIIAQFHEWMTGTGILYLEENIPQIATVFTTHATVCGRAIAGSGMPFYTGFESFNAEQSARDFHIISKHSLEKIAAHTADCFTCVSSFTAKECEKFLGKYPDFITPNGFDADIVPGPLLYNTRRAKARSILLNVATALFGQQQPEDTLLIIKSGRYEYKNKGINTFIDAISLVNKSKEIKRNILAFIFVPANHTGPRKILQDNLLLQTPPVSRTGEILTHNLLGADTDPILNHIRQQQLDNAPANHVKIIYAPVYLNGADGIFNLSYYDTLIGFDLAIFPSYYEPWGYTPLESAAFHIPAVSTNISGFGSAVSKLPGFNGKGIFIIERNDNNEREAAAGIAGIISNYAAQTASSVAAARDDAAHIAEQFLWDHLLIYYYRAYDLALQKSTQREQLFCNKPQASPAEVTAQAIPESTPVWREINVQPVLPAPLQPLQDISRNLWWSWNPEARTLYAYAGNKEWDRCKQNPRLLLKTISPGNLHTLEKDTAFLGMQQTISDAYQKYMQSPDKQAPLIAYFCMEYGLHTDLKFYAGGLGVLAGDYIKAASDNGLNMVAAGLLYKRGYFKQKISPAGGQLAIPDITETENLPVFPAQNNQGEAVSIELAFPGRIIHATVWKVDVGRITLYLLDTDLAANNEEDRLISAQLYSSDPEMRLKQEILLGIGGVKMLNALGIQPDLYHINEGHAAFTVLERIRNIMQQCHLSFDEAMEIVKCTTQFTTHTAVPAAKDVFDEILLRTYLSYLAKDFNIDWNILMKLGSAEEEHSSGGFSMLHFAASLSQEINAVSKQHRGISCNILNPLWKHFKPDELHITSITNGIHLPTWMAPAWQPYYKDIMADKTYQIPDNTIWNIRKKLKRDMWQGIINRQPTAPALYEIIKKNDFLGEDITRDTLVIGFARRFASYKRAWLLFTDIKRLAAIVNNTQYPVLIILAGKAHPNDADGIALLKKVITASQMPALNGRILFLEDYDMELAALLTQGVDVWLNTPEHNMEASGTSGMKAVCNGVLHCSPKEGWWAEANRENAGWTLEISSHPEQDAYRDQCDAAVVYDLLEKEVIPLFFERNTEGLPEKWINMIRKGLSGITPQFDMNRAINEYNRSYGQLYNRSKLLLAADCKNTRDLVAWKKRVRSTWQEIHVMTIEEPQGSYHLQSPGETFRARINLSIGTLHADEIGLEVVFYTKEQPDNYITVQELTVEAVDHNRITYSCQIQLPFSGAAVYGFRIFPRHPLLPNRQDFPLMTWI